MLTQRRQRPLHRAQADFLASPAYYRGFVGGRGAGKSFIGAYDLLGRARPGRTYLVGSPTGVLMGDTTFPAVEKLAREMGVWDRRGVKMTPYPTVRLATGAVLRFRTAEDPERMRGPNLSGCWLDEASLMPRAAYDICIAALREEGEQGWLSCTFTPKGLGHWTFSVFGGDSPKPNTAIFHAATRENPFLPAGFQKTLEEQYGGLQAQQELEGHFCNLEGAEWGAEFFPPSIWFDDWPPDLRHRVLALDPSRGRSDKSGDYSAFVMLGLDADWNLWVDADLDRRPVERQQGEPGRSIVEDGLRLVKEWRPDAFSVETNGFQELVASAFLRVARERRLHLPLYGVCSTTPKDARIRTAVTPFLAQRRLRVRNTPGGRLLVQQLRDFPEGEFDDGPDGLSQAIKLMNHVISGEGGADTPQVYRG